MPPVNPCFTKPFYVLGFTQPVCLTIKPQARTGTSPISPWITLTHTITHTHTFTHALSCRHLRLAGWCPKAMTAPQAQTQAPPHRMCLQSRPVHPPTLQQSPPWSPGCQAIRCVRTHLGATFMNINTHKYVHTHTHTHTHMYRPKETRPQASSTWVLSQPSTPPCSIPTPYQYPTLYRMSFLLVGGLKQCLRARIYTYTGVHTHTHTHTHEHTHTHTHTLTNACTHTNARTHTHPQHTFIHARGHARITHAGHHSNSNSYTPGFLGAEAQEETQHNGSRLRVSGKLSKLLCESGVQQVLLLMNKPTTGARILHFLALSPTTDTHTHPLTLTHTLSYSHT